MYLRGDDRTSGRVADSLRRSVIQPNVDAHRAAHARRDCRDGTPPARRGDPLDRRFRCRAPARAPRVERSHPRARDEDIERGRRAGLGGGALRSARAGRVHSLPAARGHRARGTPRSRARRGGACAPSAWDDRGVFLVARGGPPRVVSRRIAVPRGAFRNNPNDAGQVAPPRAARGHHRGG